MASILPIAIVVAVVSSIAGFYGISIPTTSSEAILVSIRTKCQQIANEGYKIHALYPNANPEDLLKWK